MELPRNRFLTQLCRRPGVPNERVSEQTLRVFIIGAMTTRRAGFAGFATSAYGNTYFRIKMIALVLAGANALTYHMMAKRMSAKGDAAQRPSALVRAAGLISILLWAVVILSGRMMSYTLF